MIELSLREHLALLPKRDVDEFFKDYNETDLSLLLDSYEFKARPKQLFPLGDWRTWLILSGRGFGKNFIGSNWVIKQAQVQKYPIALVGANAADVRDYIVELGESSIVKQSSDWFKPEYQPSKRRLIFPNGVVGITYSADNPDQLRGFNGNSSWVDELAKYQYPNEVWDNLNFALRIGANPKVVITTTPRPIKLIRDLNNDPSVIKTYGSTYENRHNLAASFVEFIYKKYRGTRLGEQELEGKILTDTPGALWDYSILEANRVTKAPEFKQLCIAIDPAITADEDSNETGILVCGIDKDNIGYVVADRSGVYHPSEWAKIVVDLYEQYHCAVIAETNQGGDLVTSNVIQYAKSRGYRHFPIRKVHASKSKQLRAEPISTLYEQNKIKHIGNFPDLEDQMTTWLPGNRSPDRIDALVWGFTYLMLKQEEVTEYEL